MYIYSYIYTTYTIYSYIYYMYIDKVTGTQGKDSPDTLEEKCDMYIELKLFNKAFEVAAKIKDINRLIEVS